MPHYRRVRFFRIEPRKGKANVLNTLIPRALGDIVLFSDANTILEPQALAAIVRHFENPSVGGVCGQLVLTSKSQRLEDTERTYWSHESSIKDLEGQWYSTIGANGGIYAIRKELFAPIPTDTIIDYFLISLNLLEQGKRLVFEKEAVAYEEVSKSFRDEFWRKLRIGAGNLQVLLSKWPFVYSSMFCFLLCVPQTYPLAHPILTDFYWGCSLLFSDHRVFRVVFWGYNLTLLLSVAGILGVTRNRIVLAFAFLYAFNLALLIAYERYLLGMQWVAWRRAQR